MPPPPAEEPYGTLAKYGCQRLTTEEAMEACPCLRLFLKFQGDQAVAVLAVNKLQAGWDRCAESG